MSDLEIVIRGCLMFEGPQPHSYAVYFFTELALELLREG
jgi:hypothetical protein